MTTQMITRTAPTVEMIPVKYISQDTRNRAETLNLEVEQVTPRLFFVPSASDPAHFHFVEVNSTLNPIAFCCTCRAFEYGRGCHAAAAVVAALEARNATSEENGRLQTALEFLRAASRTAAFDSSSFEDSDFIARMVHLAQMEILAELAEGGAR